MIAVDKEDSSRWKTDKHIQIEYNTASILKFVDGWKFIYRVCINEISSCNIWMMIVGDGN